MALYDYGNTRLRARISRLLPIQMLESFSDLTSIDSLISALTKTPIKSSIETALTYAHGYGCIVEAMRRELGSVVTDLSRYYEGDVLAHVNMIFKRIDLLNIKALLRGLAHETSIEVITDSFSPLGTIPNTALIQIAKSKDVYDAINRILIFELPMAQVLMELKASHQELSATLIELTLERWYFEQVKQDLKGSGEEMRILREYYAIEADIINLNNILRFVEASDAYADIEEDLQTYLIEPGSISMRTLLSLSKKGSAEEVIRVLLTVGLKHLVQQDY